MNHIVSKLPVFLTAKEMERLVNNVRKDRHRLGIALMSYGGLRVSEMCNLKISDINVARGFMKITGKGNKQRFVPLTVKLQNMVEQFLNKHGADLTTESLLLGRSRANWHYVVKKYSREILYRDDVHCHTLRHSYATALYEKGVQLERISQLLGHSRLDTTMIYSHISMNHKRDAVRVLDDRKTSFMRFLSTSMRRVPELKVQSFDSLIGREREMEELQRHIDAGRSVVLYGQKGAGKSAVLKSLEHSIYIDEYKKKTSLIYIILHPKNLARDLYKAAEKELKKLSIDELIEQIHLSKPDKPVIIDDITELSRADRKVIARLSRSILVITSTSRHPDTKLFPTFVEVKPLKRYNKRQVLSDMIQMNNQKEKEAIIDDIIHTAGDNIKEAAYIVSQMQLGKKAEEITSNDRASNQMSIAPFLLVVVLFFAAWVLKSYTTSAVAFSYALLIVFRLIFMRYLFMPANRKRAVQ